MTFQWILLFLNSALLCDGRKNVLFLMSDDLRAEINAYTRSDVPFSVHPKMFTPNLDALAAKSLLLKRAYVQQALCSPSRSSLLTGRRPDTTHVYNLHTYFRNVGGNYTTIPQYFKMKGYETIGMGKIFHRGHDTGDDDPLSWTKPYFHGVGNWEDGQNSWKAVPDNMLKDKPLQDKQVADLAVSTLRKLAPKAKSGEKPFFLAVGFQKPHLPFVFPKSFMDHYPMSTIHLPNNQYAPKHMPPVAWANYGELRSRYHDIMVLNATGDINSTLPSNVVLDLRRAYYSTISYVDSLVGLVVSELSNLGLENNTVVSFIGDHGWQLGEHGEWCKHTNFELATHAPMMIRVPGKTDNGIVTDKLVEFVDLFPTLVEAADFSPIPLCPEDSTNIELCREGMSLMPLIKNQHITWKNASFSQYPRHQKGSNIMGYTIRTNRYRYTEWVKFHGKPTFKPDWNVLFGVELYDHQTDPDENINKAHHSFYPQLRARLSQQLRAGWRHSVKTTSLTDIFGR